MKTITQLYDEVYLNDSTKDSRIFLSIVGPEADSLLKSDFYDYDERYKTTRLTSDYAIKLANTGFIKKAIPFLNHAILLFESDEKLKGKDLLDEPMFQVLLFTRAESFYNLKLYSAAKQDFKKLSAKWPDNDKYKNWYNASVSYRLNQIEWGITALIAICLVLGYIVKFKTQIINYISLLLIIGFVTTYILKSLKKVK